MPHPSPATPPPHRRPDAPGSTEPTASETSAEPVVSAASAERAALDAPAPPDASPAERAASAPPDPASAERAAFAAPDGSDVLAARAGAESGWSPRLGRLGAAEPVPAAGRAQRFGAPVVPLLVAALVAGAFVVVRGGAEQDLAHDGRPGGEQVGVPSPRASDAGDATSSTDGQASDTRGGHSGTPGGGAPDARADITPTDATPSDATVTADATADGAPTRTGPAHPPSRADGSVTRVSPTPSRGGTTAPTPRPTGTVTRDRTPARPVSFEALRVGDCFDIDRDAPGTALRRSCDTPHHAELVSRLRLTGVLATDTAVREAAAVLCREPLRRKAALQPLGTRWTTFVQYPYRTSYLLGSATVACSLVAPSATGGKLSRPLL
ncbi:hypothetical protein ACFWV1_23865 [Streptomyces sp. NPDC058700]|uniref:hypothetical protein n=1 Tax=Streptomyces sp. NPDC058700 TaxID=3346607 RepID=UPI003650A5B6